MEPSQAQVPVQRSLFEIMQQIPDPRRPRGRRYPLAAILTMAATAILCGCRGLSAIAQWGRDHRDLVPLFGFPRLSTPCTSNLHYVFAALDSLAFEAALTQWMLEQGHDLPSKEVAIDGKTLRGSRRGAIPGVHLLSAYAHELGGVLTQLQVEGKTNEHKAALELIRLIPLHGTLVSGDAIFAQKDLCHEIIERKGDYFFSVKENQPSLLADIQAAFPQASATPRPHAPDPRVRQARTIRKGHGRVEIRQVWATDQLNTYLNWPGVQQVCLLRRTRIIRGQRSEETGGAITSLSAARAGADELLRIGQQHWGIENRLHWVRDVTLGEDACRVRTSSAPQILAGLRNAALRLLRAAGATNIAAALRQHAAKAIEAVHLVLNPVPAKT